MTRRAKLLGSAAIPAGDMALVVAVLDALIAPDDTVTGATVFMPDGEVRYIDAALLRRGGRA